MRTSFFVGYLIGLVAGRLAGHWAERHRDHPAAPAAGYAGQTAALNASYIADQVRDLGLGHQGSFVDGIEAAADYIEKRLRQLSEALG